MIKPHLATGVLALAMMVGCGDASPDTSATTNGPISFGDGVIETCAPAETYSHMAYGQLLSIDGGHSATIREVHFPDVRNVELGRVLLQKSLGSHGVTLETFPIDIQSWPDVVPAAGAALPDDGEPVNLILEVFHRGSEPGFVGRTEIEITVDGAPFLAIAQNTLVIGEC